MPRITLPALVQRRNLDLSAPLFAYFQDGGNLVQDYAVFAELDPIRVIFISRKSEWRTQR